MVEQDQHAIYLLESLKKIYEVNKLFFLILNNFKIILAWDFPQCFGSGSGRIRIIWPDPDPYQEMLIWIRVPKKQIVINSHTNQPKL